MVLFALSAAKSSCRFALMLAEIVVACVRKGAGGLGGGTGGDGDGGDGDGGDGGGLGGDGDGGMGLGDGGLGFGGYGGCVGGRRVSHVSGVPQERYVAATTQSVAGLPHADSAIHR